MRRFTDKLSMTIDNIMPSTPLGVTPFMVRRALFARIMRPKRSPKTFLSLLSKTIPFSKNEKD